MRKEPTLLLSLLWRPFLMERARNPKSSSRGIIPAPPSSYLPPRTPTPKYGIGSMEGPFPIWQFGRGGVHIEFIRQDGTPVRRAFLTLFGSSSPFFLPCVCRAFSAGLKKLGLGVKRTVFHSSPVSPAILWAVLIGFFLFSYRSYGGYLSLGRQPILLPLIAEGLLVLFSGVPAPLFLFSFPVFCRLAAV